MSFLVVSCNDDDDQPIRPSQPDVQTTDPSENNNPNRGEDPEEEVAPDPFHRLTRTTFSTHDVDTETRIISYDAEGRIAVAETDYLFKRYGVVPNTENHYRYTFTYSDRRIDYMGTDMNKPYCSGKITLSDKGLIVREELDFVGDPEKKTVTTYDYDDQGKLTLIYVEYPNKQDQGNPDLRKTHFDWDGTVLQYSLYQGGSKLYFNDLTSEGNLDINMFIYDIGNLFGNDPSSRFLAAMGYYGNYSDNLLSEIAFGLSDHFYGKNYKFDEENYLVSLIFNGSLIEFFY